MKPYKKYLLKNSLVRCGLMASCIGALINILLFKEGRMVWYLGVEVFFTTFFTSVVCCLIYINIYKKEETCAKAPKMPYNLKYHIILKRFPKKALWQSVYMGVMSAVFFGALPAVFLMIVGQDLECPKALWVLSKWATAMFYVPFSVYYTCAFKITEYQTKNRKKS